MRELYILFTMKKERSAGIVVFRRDGGGPLYLLLQNSHRKFWDFAKGNIDPGETEERAAAREAEEEAGLKNLKIVPGFREKMKYVYRFEGELIDKEVVMFLGEERDGEEARLSWEHSTFKWAPFEEARKLLKGKKLEVLEKANKFLSGRIGNWTSG